MVDDIARVLETLRADSARCPVHPVSAIRRRGDRRRTAVRAAAAGSTLVLVGATAGTAVALDRQASDSPGHSKVGFATSTSSSPAPVPSGPGAGSATPVPSLSPEPSTSLSIPTPGGATTGVPRSPGSAPGGATTGVPRSPGSAPPSVGNAFSPTPTAPPSLGPGTAQPTASPTPTSS